MTRELTRLNLQISSAKISTYGEKVVDVFYVKNLFGHKVEQPAKLSEIRQTLEAVLARGNDAATPRGRPRARRGGVDSGNKTRAMGPERPKLLPQIFEEFLDPGEEAFAFGVDAAVLAFLLEFAQQFLLALGQIDWGFDDRLDEHVAARSRAQDASSPLT